MPLIRHGRAAIAYYTGRSERQWPKNTLYCERDLYCEGVEAGAEDCDAKEAAGTLGRANLLMASAHHIPTRVDARYPCA